MATSYAFDPTGTNPANRVTLESHVLTAIDFRDYDYVIPNFAPFFSNNITISFRDAVTNNPVTLTEGVDYYFTHQFIGASRATASPVYGSITFLNNNIAGVLQLSYNTIGGVWTLDTAGIATILANALQNPRITTWEQVANPPAQFPVIDHQWNLVDMVGASSMVSALEDIRNAIFSNSNTSIGGHLTDYNNPHQTTKAQVGLGLVANYPIATTGQAVAGTSNSTYMTPGLTALMISNISSSALTIHINNTSNPHQTTKSQIGLGNVDNYATATNGDALAGTSSVLFMTPATTKAVSDALTTSLNGHINNTSNPHGTTAAQVGLGSVQNYALATTQQAQAGSATNAYMTPALTSSAITALALTPLNSHTGDQTNPHVTTKAQVGLGNVQNYAVATQSEAETASSNSTYMTPQRTSQLVLANAATIMASHTSNLSNPHQTTAAQIGLGNVQNYGVASAGDAATGASNTLYMTPSTTASAINALVPAPAVISGKFKGLNGFSAGSDAVMNYYIEEIIVKDSSNNTKIGRNLSLSVNLGSTGTNGLDSGTVAASTLYTYWVIHNPTTSTWAAIAAKVNSITGNTVSGSATVTNIGSTANLKPGMPFWNANFPAGSVVKSVDSGTQFTANKPASATVTGSTFRCTYEPVMPSGFTYKTRIGSGLTASDSTVRKQIQMGNATQINPTIALAGGGTATIDMSGLIPPSANQMATIMASGASSGGGAFIGPASGQQYGGGSNGNGQYFAGNFQVTFALETQYVYFVSAVGNAAAYLTGWTDEL